jgi:hypothetical protein
MRQAERIRYVPKKPYLAWKSFLFEVTLFQRFIRTKYLQLATNLYFRATTRIVIGVIFFLLLLGQFGPGEKTAFATQTKPPTDWSFYMSTTSTSQVYTLGCNQGEFDASFNPPVNSEVVLDFGGQNSSGTGTIMINNNSISNSQIEAVVEEFSYAYYVCTRTDSTSVLTLGIGTNNSAYDVNTSGGKTWAQIISTVISYNHSKGYDSQVGVDGANDIEPGFNSASASISWAQGYSSINPAHYLDYGSADGCPTNYSGNGSCYNGWNQYDVWYVSWGAAPELPIPEIYYSSMAQEWAMISLYGAQHQNSTVYMQGPWDEYDLDSSTDTSTSAWNQLWTDLNNNSLTKQNMSYSAEIHWE